MTHACSEDLRGRALARVDAGETIRASGRAPPIRPSCVSKWRQAEGAGGRAHTGSDRRAQEAGPVG